MRHAEQVAARRPTILIVEDDDGVRHALERGLDHAGFATVIATSAASAAGIDEFDLALIDLGLPDRDGIDVCRDTRGRHPERPIIVVTGRHEELDVVDALDSGADDYVTKPFSLAVLTARIRRHLDRSADVTTVGPLRIDRRARRAMLNGVEVDLAPREFDLLAALAASAGEVVDKNELMARVWDEHWSKSTRTLAVHVSALRGKLRGLASDAVAIVAVPGSGYRLDAGSSNR